MLHSLVNPPRGVPAKPAFQLASIPPGLHQISLQEEASKRLFHHSNNKPQEQLPAQSGNPFGKDFAGHHDLLLEVHLLRTLALTVLGILLIPCLGAAA